MSAEHNEIAFFAVFSAGLQEYLFFRYFFILRCYCYTKIFQDKFQNFNRFLFCNFDIMFYRLRSSFRSCTLQNIYRTILFCLLLRLIQDKSSLTAKSTIIIIDLTKKISRLLQQLYVYIFNEQDLMRAR